MVGKKPKRLTFAERIGGCLGKPFVRGSTGSDSFDCLGLVAALFWDRGLYFPDHFEQWDKNNYHEYYTNDLQNAIQTMIRFFDSFMGRTTGKVAGDVLLVEQPDKTQFVAIYTGNGQAVTSFIRDGVTVFKLDELNKPIIAWRPTCRA